MCWSIRRSTFHMARYPSIHICSQHAKHFSSRHNVNTIEDARMCDYWHAHSRAATHTRRRRTLSFQCGCMRAGRWYIYAFVMMLASYFPPLAAMLKRYVFFVNLSALTLDPFLYAYFSFKRSGFLGRSGALFSRSLRLANETEFIWKDFPSPSPHPAFVSAECERFLCF